MNVNVNMNIKKGYAFCKNQWAIDKDIKNELGLLLIISSLCAKTGFTYITNKFLAAVFKEHDVNISKKLGILQAKGYIQIEYIRHGAEVVLRKIYFSDFGEEKSELAPAPKQTVKKEPDPLVQLFVEEYNKCGLPQCVRLTPQRADKISKRLKEFTPEEVKKIFEKVRASNFLQGRTDCGWQANIDWLIKSSNNMQKVLEGNYDNKKSKSQPEQQTAEENPYAVELFRQLDTDHRIEYMDGSKRIKRHTGYNEADLKVMLRLQEEDYEKRRNYSGN